MSRGSVSHFCRPFSRKHGLPKVVQKTFLLHIIRIQGGRLIRVVSWEKPEWQGAWVTENQVHYGNLLFFSPASSVRKPSPSCSCSWCFWYWCVRAWLSLEVHLAVAHRRRTCPLPLLVNNTVGRDETRHIGTETKLGAECESTLDIQWTEK